MRSFPGTDGLIETTGEPITTTTAEPCFLEKTEPPLCFFLDQVLEKAKLFKRCQTLRSPQTIVYNNIRTVLVEGRRCGVTNATDVEGSDICFSEMLSEDSAGTNKLSTQIHDLKLGINQTNQESE